MCFKLALKNVKKSYKDYLIYFLTLAFSICLFYAFNSFQEQQALLNLDESSMASLVGLSEIMKWLSIFVGIVLGVLVLYANNFIIKRRKKEFATYMLLGMSQKKMSLILVYETFLIGLISLIVGLGLGIFLSQLLTGVTASLFEATLNYSFLFSIEAFLLTVGAFVLIFLVAMMFNTFVLNRYKLIDLLNADKRNEVLYVRKVWLYVIIFMISIVCLGIAYYLVLHDPIESVRYLPIAIMLGIIGTLCFFVSLSGFLVKFLQISKRIYFRNLNMFVLREVNASVKSNLISMSVVCIMLLLSIGSLTVGFTLQQQSNATVKSITPYDASIQSLHIDDPESSVIVEGIDRVVEDNKEDFQSVTTIGVYNITAYINNSYDYLGDYMYTEEGGGAIFNTIKLSDYNALMNHLHEDEIQLKDNQVAMSAGEQANQYQPMKDNLLKDKKDITIDGKDYELTNPEITNYSIGTLGYKTIMEPMLIVPDDVIGKDKIEVYRFTNLTYKKDVDVKKVYKSMEEGLNKIQFYDQGVIDSQLVVFTDIASAKSQAAGDKVMLTYISVYLGTVFLLSSAVILALQQLSKADDSRKRYTILSKIGSDKKMIHRSIFLQVSIYFGIPLLLAIIHSIVGIAWSLSIIALISDISFMEPILLTSLIILGVYGCYFIITYNGYKAIVTKKK